MERICFYSYNNPFLMNLPINRYKYNYRLPINRDWFAFYL